MKTKSEYQNFESLASKLLSVPHAEIKARLDAEKKAKKLKPKKVRAAVGLLLLLFSSAARAQVYEAGSVVRWEKKSYSQSAHIIRNQTVYTVVVGDLTYQIARRSDKVEMNAGQQLKCRVEKGHLIVLNEKGKETKYDIVGAQ
jgi:hypothetical protein